MTAAVNVREAVNIAEREVRQRLLCFDAEKVPIEMQCRYFGCDVTILERARRVLVGER